MKRYELGLISKNRPAVYAISALVIMFFHSAVTFENSFLMNIKNRCSCGVDIFLLVSGICLYFSMKKNPGVRDFYLRRLKRVLLPALIVSAAWFIYTDLIGKGDFRLFLMDISGITLFTRGTKAVWFVTAIILDYLLYPFIFRYFEKRHWSKTSFAVLFIASFAVNLILRLLLPEIYRNSEILWRRLPVFVTGCYLGAAVYENRTLPINTWVIAAATIALTIVSIYIPFREIGHLRYVFLPLAAGYTLLFAKAGEWKPLHKPAAFLAPLSLEIYLLHEKLLFLLGKTALLPLPLNLLAAALAILGACLLNRAEKLLTRRSFK